LCPTETRRVGAEREIVLGSALRANGDISGYSSGVPEPVDDQFRLRRLRIQRQLAPSARHRWQRGRVSQPHTSDQVPGRPHRRWSSRQLHRLGGAASHAWAGVIVAMVALAWVLDGALTGFPSYWLAILQSVTAVVTVVMLFVIQHLQARDRTVLQRTLDEILRSLPNADNRVIAIEEAPDAELETLTDLNRRDRLG
jgi:low affinity Fe/Cu permease